MIDILHLSRAYNCRVLCDIIKSHHCVTVGPRNVLEKSLVLIHEELWRPCTTLATNNDFLFFAINYKYIVTDESVSFKMANEIFIWHLRE